MGAQLELGSLTGQIANITSRPQLFGAPLTDNFLGREIKQIAEIGKSIIKKIKRQKREILVRYPVSDKSGLDKLSK